MVRDSWHFLLEETGYYDPFLSGNDGTTTDFVCNFGFVISIDSACDMNAVLTVADFMKYGENPTLFI